MKRPKRFILKQRNNKIVMIIVITVLIFPLLVGAIYALPLPQVIAVESGDLLAYYGTSLGILGSFITYQAERKRTDKAGKNLPDRNRKARCQSLRCVVRCDGNPGSQRPKVAAV